MQNEIIRETRKVFIRRKVEQGDRKMTLRMITENHIEGLLRSEIRHMDGGSWLYYEVTGLHTLRDLYEDRQMASRDLSDLVICLDELGRRLADFFVSERQLLLSPEEIYRDVETGDFFFQIGSGERDGEAEKLLDYLITVMDHGDEDFTDRVYEAQSQAEKGFVIIGELAEKCKALRGKKIVVIEEAEEEYGSAEDTGYERDLWEEDDAEELFPEEAEKLLPAKDLVPFKKIGKRGLSLPQWVKTLGAALLCLLAVFALGTYLNMHMLAVIALLLLVVAAFLLRELIRRVGAKKREVFVTAEADEGDLPEPFGEEELWGEADPETAILFQKKEPEKGPDGTPVHQTKYLEDEERPAMLYGQGEFKNLTFHIEGEMMTLGKSPEYADLVVPDPTVSRLHARIYRDGETCRIRDLGSLNGTFKNGELLSPEEEEEVSPGDELLFGRAAFTFR